MHVKLTDFGTAKVLETVEEEGGKKGLARSESFVGTPEFVSPELLLDQFVFSSLLFSSFFVVVVVVKGLGKK